MNDHDLQNLSGLNKPYAVIVLLLSIVLPFTGWTLEHFIKGMPLDLSVFCKWFIFFAVGIRLFMAGIRQTLKPAFTAKEIFHIDQVEVEPIVRELGFANLCFGLIGIVSFFLPGWRIISAFASGIYYGLAGIQHLVKKPVSANEKLALWTDLFIFVILLIYFVRVS
jgi:hypothetical protein